MKKIKLAKIDYEQVEGEIKNFILENTLELNKTGAVIGLSGGVDSTLSAILTKKAFDMYNNSNENKLELKGYILPSKVNNNADLLDAKEFAEKLGINYKIIEIEPFVNVYDKMISEIKKNLFDRGNLMSRIRANVLHTNAALENKLVMGTGNKDEDYGLGYYTLFGDGAVHLSPLGELAKRHVKELVSHYGFEKIANREPTAGLELSQTDFNDLGYTYDLAELVIEGIDQGLNLDEVKKNNQVIHEFTKYATNSKFNLVDTVVDDIMKRHNIAIKKAQLVSPKIAQITKEYL